MIKVDCSGAASFWGDGPDYAAAAAAHRILAEKSGPGGEFTGWLTLPQTMEQGELPAILAAAERIRQQSQVLVVVGIGGSYLGARAAYELLEKGKDGVELLFAGTSLSPDHLNALIGQLGERDFSVNVISKSGTTLEPALSFRVFRELLVRRYGERADERIYATTDRARGALRKMADEKGWPTFVVPDDVGGRYSVLSAVGLLPMAAAGLDVVKMIAAAKDCFAVLDERSEKNPAWQYAAARQKLRAQGREIEILACYEPSFRMMAEWWKQLYGESEGKNGLGLFPASVEFNADLHSMGQYIQDGPRTLVETVVSFEKARSTFAVPAEASDADGLNYLAGRDFGRIAAVAAQAVKEAHIQGGVPNLGVQVSARDERGFAELVCFFELACAISGYMMGVNPFDQPGVEAYKQNMFRLLGQWK